MDNDFFEEREENSSSSVEQGENTEATPPVLPENKEIERARALLRWAKIFFVLSLCIVLFVGGYYVRWWTLDPEIRTLITVKEGVQKEYYEEVTDEQFYDGVFNGVNGILDKHSYYMTAEEFEAALKDLDGERSGIGVVFYTNEKDLRVARVCGNSPAEAAGLVEDDVVLGCGKSKEEIVAVGNFDEFSALLSTFAEKEEFYLRLQSGEEVREVLLYKAQFVENYLFYRTSEQGYAVKEGKLVENNRPLSSLPQDTAYIRLLQFGGNAAADFPKLMAQFKADGKKNLVLDLRENGGGYMDILQEIASYFCKNATEDKPIIAVADYGERKEIYRARGNYYKEYFAEDSRIFVLADEGSASASECLIGVMADYGALAFSDICLIDKGQGARTFGKGIMQETFELSNGQGILKLTTAVVRWPVSNRSINEVGILPIDGAVTSKGDKSFEKETNVALQTLFPPKKTV